MIDDVALGAEAASPWARVATLLLDASAIGGAVAVQHALWATLDVGVATVLGSTGANPVVAQGVLTARRGIALVSDYGLI